MDIAPKNLYETLESRRIEARKLRAAGYSYIQIAKELGCSRSYASKWCKLNEDELRPKIRGVKQKISEDLKSELLIEFIASDLSVRKFMQSKHEDILKIVSLRTIDKYFYGVRPKPELNKRKLEYIDFDKFCENSNKSFPEFCHKVRKNSNNSFYKLETLFYLTRKSENWKKWEAGKNKPLKSTRLQLAFLAYYFGFSHGEMLPEGLISKKTSSIYTRILHINWQMLIVKDVSIDEIIESLILFTRKNTGRKSSINFPSYCKNPYFIKTSNELLTLFFTLFNDNNKSSQWMPPHNYDPEGDLLDCMLRVSYFLFSNKNIAYQSDENSF